MFKESNIFSDLSDNKRGSNPNKGVLIVEEIISNCESENTLPILVSLKECFQGLSDFPEGPLAKSFKLFIEFMSNKNIEYKGLNLVVIEAPTKCRFKTPSVEFYLERIGDDEVVEFIL